MAALLRAGWRTTILCGAGLGLAGWGPLTAQSNDPEGPPKTIFGVYGDADRSRARLGRNSVRISRRSEGKIGVALKLYYANGHTCQLDKEGEWKDGYLLVVADGLSPNEACQLEGSFSQGRIRLTDEAGRCARVYCGTRGKLDGVVLRKKGR